jgi:hypothetical protein
MPKTIQGLEKRTGSIFFSSNSEILDMGSISVGDIARLINTDGETFDVCIDNIRDDDTFIGTVKRTGLEPKLNTGGIKRGDCVIEHLDFIHEIQRNA